MDMKIKKIYQFGTYDEKNEWVNDGETVVIYEDESIPPLRVSGRDAYKAFDAYAQELGIDTEATPDNIVEIIEKAVDNGLLSFQDLNKTKEANAAIVEIGEAENKARAAAELAKKENPAAGLVVTPPTSKKNDEMGADSAPASEQEPEDLEDNKTPPTVIAPPTVEDVENERDWGEIAKNVGLGVVAAAGLGAAAYGVVQALDNDVENTQEVDNDLTDTQVIDYNTATFDEIMASMPEDSPRREIAQRAMNLTVGFHDATHKDGNFRLEADAENYLDLSYEEALVITLFADNTTSEELYAILGDFNISAEQVQDLLESGRSKIITYYMNATEPFGLSQVFTNENDRVFFEELESLVVTFNSVHANGTEEEARIASDNVIRYVYYNYLVDGAANINATEVSPMARLFAFDLVYGGLNLTETASVDHTQYLVFNGLGDEKELEWYVTNVLNLDYSTLSEEDKATYSQAIIRQGTELVRLNANGEAMHEDNTSAEELNSAEVSITNLVDRMGLCNEANALIAERISALDSLSLVKDTQIATINQNIARELRQIGNADLDAIATSIEQNPTQVIDASVLETIRLAGADSLQAVDGYEESIANINHSNLPGMDVIINAANRETALLENYAGSIGDVAILVNNRRHTTQLELTPSTGNPSNENPSGGPTGNGTEDTKTEETPVDYEDLTPEEKEEVDDQRNEQEAQIALNNANANGKIDANEFANTAGAYQFSVGSVTNPYNNEVLMVTGEPLVNGINYLVAFGNSQGVPSSSDAQIQADAEKSANEYIAGLSQSERDAIATAMGVSWSEAESQIKQSFISGYTTQMDAEIGTAIQVGREHAESAKKAAEEAMAETTPEETQPTPGETEQPSIEEGETQPEQQPEETQPAPEEPTVGEDVQPAPEETQPSDDYDPNIDIVTGPGEQVVEEGEVELDPQPTPGAENPGYVETPSEGNQVEQPISEAPVENTQAAPEAQITAPVEVQDAGVVTPAPSIVEQETTNDNLAAMTDMRDQLRTALENSNGTGSITFDQMDQILGFSVQTEEEPAKTR